MEDSEVDRLAAIVGYVTRLARSGQPADVDMLNRIAVAAGLTVSADATPNDLRKAIGKWLNLPAQRSDLDTVIAKLKSATLKVTY